MRDSMEYEGATLLAKRIADYWKNQGYDKIKTWTFKILYEKSRGELYGVRSNMIRGFPPKELT